MAEYIKRDDALRQVLLVETRENMFQCIKNLPAADVVERKTGKWISYIEDGYLECPFCGAATNCDGDESELHFCFNCGAKMEGVKNDV